MTDFLLTVAYSYFLGSIPFGYILVRTFRGQDVRQTGSGNIGATNVSRTSPRLGALTLILDALKGLSAVLLTRALFPTQQGLMFTAALFAIVGHVFPVWLRFRGGKGVATGLGSFALLTPKTILVMIAIFILIFLAFRYVSIASILSVALFPLMASILEPDMNWRTVGITAAASLIIIVRHRENIRRLMNHTESRFQWRRT